MVVRRGGGARWHSGTAADADLNERHPPPQHAQHVDRRDSTQEPQQQDTQQWHVQQQDTHWQQEQEQEQRRSVLRADQAQRCHPAAGGARDGGAAGGTHGRSGESVSMGWAREMNRNAPATTNLMPASGGGGGGGGDRGGQAPARRRAATQVRQPTHERATRLHAEREAAAGAARRKDALHC